MQDICPFGNPPIAVLEASSELDKNYLAHTSTPDNDSNNNNSSWWFCHDRSSKMNEATNQAAQNFNPINFPNQIFVNPQVLHAAYHLAVRRSFLASCKRTQQPLRHTGKFYGDLNGYVIWHSWIRRDAWRRVFTLLQNPRLLAVLFSNPMFNNASYAKCLVSSLQIEQFSFQKKHQ